MKKRGRLGQAIGDNKVLSGKIAIFLPANLGKNTNTRNLLFLLLHN